MIAAAPDAVSFAPDIEPELGARIVVDGLKGSFALG